MIENPEVDKNALLYLQLDEQVKVLSNARDSVKSELEGFTGTTLSGVEVLWTSVSGRKTVDAKEVEKLLGFVPYVQGQESVRLSIKPTGGK